MRALSVAAVFLLAACATGWPTGFSREAPAAVYPAGELSGPPTWFVGWKWQIGR